jgi:deoxyribonuclease IV
MGHELLVGAHMSIAGGMHLAFERGVRAGCLTLQLFLKNSTQWKGKALAEADRLLFREAESHSGIRPVLAHSSYLINLASPDPVLRRKSLDAFQDEMERARLLGVPFLVLHPGSHMGAGEKQGIARVADGLDQALERIGPPVMILLENTAGQGTSIGHRFEHLAAILRSMRHADRVGVCIDTCHTFAAGYDIRTRKAYMRTVDEIDRFIGLQRVRAIHVNDCRKELGSHVDRHTHIGQGLLGLEPFRLLVNDERFAGTPKILETPKGEDLKEDMMNLATLRSLVSRGSARSIRKRSRGTD